ncbi:hypothetical protein EDB89DRAFT_2063142 [Lactarius sanguifluus]|nr:hypothetical protein EDB89DRAFT_2063142 [Lactarius sanguifluus]
MSAFTFDFDLEDDLDESFDVIPPQNPTAASVHPIGADSVPEGLPVSEAELPAEEIPLSELLSALPEALSYSPLALPANGTTLVRRDLFDARFQLLAQGRDEQAALVDAPADLVPGVYEGGLKTWECALDLAAYLDRDVVLGAQAGLRVLELGCGTAAPTLLLLDRLFAFLASSETGGAPRASDGEQPICVPETEIHLQDYNRAVLELVTFPNVLLAWCTFRPSLVDSPMLQLFTDVSPLSAQYRASAPDADSDSDDGAVSASIQTRGHERRQGGLTVTPALLAAFKTSLDAHRVCLRFFSGGWTSLRAHWGASPPPYDIVLASETIYRTEALRPFLGVLRAAIAGSGVTLCLVAAKVLYFGVGGGVREFVRVVEDEGGTVHTVWEHREGVGRRIMRVEW